MASPRPSEKDLESINARAQSPTGSDEKLDVADITKADAALAFLRDRGDVPEMTPQDEKRLVRKIDWMIMPLMWTCYVLQYLDKTLINYAAVMGLYEDANITTNQFSDLALIFYVSFLVFEFPHGYMMQRFPTAKYLGIMVMCWGVIVAVTSACKDFAGLVVTRVLLGVFEAAVAPSLMLITSMWFKRAQQPIRTGIWYLGTGTGVIIGSLISFGFQHYNGTTFFSWQIMFLTVGIVTILAGVTVFLLLPDNPMSSRLTTTEKYWSLERVRENQTGVENKTFKPRQMIECFLDPQTWMLSLITISSNVPNGAVSSYQATIIRGFGYDSKTAALLQLPSGAVSVVSIMTATYLAGRFNQRGFNVVALLIPGIIGACLMAYLPANNKAGRLIGNYMTNSIGASLPLLYSWVSANYAGHTKKVSMNAILLMSFCIGNIIGPLTFRGSVTGAFVAIIVTCVFASAMAVVLRFYYLWENKRRDRAMAEKGLHHTRDVEFADKTDRENPEFRYTL
ncbi:High-affinity nicotinic acid transporter [Sphaceloma murrayae]|uniref:High-affinity nicotinic acid transporter n=1 Tax=Sphaceloma murrayae TaxID=2082308 RepID=A0A2K1QL48_9PEZI|nr:High-affinity nicotinic acid transporter [Sphaceloma murrayae]